MDLILGRAVKLSSLLTRKTSKCLVPVDLEILGRHFCCLNSGHRNVDALEKCRKSREYHSLLINRVIRNTNFARPTIVESKFAYSDSAKNKDEEKKPSLFQKMKQMYKDYWYILIPVHIVTSIGWASIFYVASTNGIDFVKVMQNLHFSEHYVDMLKNSHAGHWAITYAMYKIFTPLRYTVTLGGTTMSIRYLNKWGYLKFKDSKQILSDAVKKMRDGKKSKE